MLGYHIESAEPSDIGKSLLRQTISGFVSRNPFGMKDVEVGFVNLINLGERFLNALTFTVSSVVCRIFYASH
jgi:hypothetical protein